VPHHSLTVLCEVDRSFRDWLDSIRRSPDPTSQPPGALKRLSEQLKQVDQAVREAPHSVLASVEWREELGAYVETLRDLRTSLGNLQISLRVRRALLDGERSRANGVHSWAELAKHVG
jgi:hypothetical protein